MDPTQIPIRDLHVPGAIGWWPLAPGWWLLIGLLVLALAWFLYTRYLRWRANRARRAALSQLAAIETEYGHANDPVVLAKQLSELLRRALLAYAPRRAVAGLTGHEWLEFLDRGLDEPLFANGPGRRIESLPYERPSARADDVAALIDAVRKRLRTPLPGEAG